MTIQFVDSFLPAASVNQSFSTAVVVTGGTAPYSFAITAGTLPAGLSMSAAGIISGNPTILGLSTVTILCTDATSATVSRSFDLQVLDLVQLQNSTVDQAQFVQQFEADLGSTGGAWTTGLTTETSQTLIEAASAVGTFATSKIDRAKEDCFPATAQSDSAIRNITIMQGVRLSRKLPAVVPATVTSTVNQTIGPFSQFSGGGYSWFTFEAYTLVANVPQTINLRQGQIVTKTVSGLGTNFQAWVSPEDGFVVSDQDVRVFVNSADVTKVYGALWNYPGMNAVTDTTNTEGSLQLQFGANGYGLIPNTNDVVTISYATTEGDSVNGLALNNVAVTGSNISNVTGFFTAAASGGAPEKSTIAYKNFSAGSFGTYSSGITKAQYAGLVVNYPGIIDAVTMAQREINPTALKWMNVIRISALTSGSWTDSQVDEFLTYMQSVTQFSPRFVFVPPTPIPNDVVLNVYCYNSVQSLSAVQKQVSDAITNLFAPRAGLLNLDLHPDDLSTTSKNSSPGQIDYIDVVKPTGPMIVTTPLSPKLTAEVRVDTGSLTAQVYNYAVSAEVPKPNVQFQGLIDAANYPSWPNGTVIGQYWIIRSSGKLGGGGGTDVNTGDKVVCTSVGSTSANFSITAYGSHDAIEVGSPINWISPQVLYDGSSIALFWTDNPVPNAIFYHIWGRRPGYIGILQTVVPDYTTYLDVGSGGDPTPASISQSDVDVQYNTLNSLIVNVYYSTRQSNATLPVRDATQ